MSTLTPTVLTSAVQAGDPLHVRQEPAGPEATRIVLIGQLDLATAPMLYEQLLGVVSGGGPAVIDVDLAELTFLDCAGLNVLLRLRKAAVHTGCQLRVVHPQPIVHRILSVTGLLDVLSSAD